MFSRGTVGTDAIYRKLALSALGLMIALGTASDQNAEVATAYLVERGYIDVTVGTPKPYYGRGTMRFPFTGQSKAGKYVSGELSLGSYSYFYRIKLHNQ